MIKFTKEELNKMTDKQLLNIDISSTEEEAIIQEIKNSRITSTTQPVKFNTVIVPDIKNPEQESEWQSKIDEFNAGVVPVEAQVLQAEKELEAVKTELDSIPEVPEVPSELGTGNDIGVDNLQSTIKKSFCDSCDSKGVVHKKDCIKNPKNLKHE